MESRHFQILTILLIFVTKYSNTARIFASFPTPSISHQVVFRALTEELTRRGHELVVLTTDPVNYQNVELKNMTQIDVHDISYDVWRKEMHFAMDRMVEPSPLHILDTYMDIMLKICDIQLSHPDMIKLLNNPKESFDLCIVEGTLAVNTAFKDRFNCSLIQFNSFVGVPSNYEIHGCPTHPTLYFDMFNPYDDDEVDIWKKLELFKMRFDFYKIRNWKFTKPYQELAVKHFGPNVRSIDETESEADLIFLNYHPQIVGTRPLVPTVVHLGSMHIKQTKPSSLPANIQKVLDDAKNGAIYFSFGSNVRSSDLPAVLINEILQAFKSLPYTILWKWEKDELPNKPQNVFIYKWYPQQSVLAHPNVKAFITQGGQQSMEEAIHYGVPMIGMPFMADQAANVARIVRLKIGKRLFIETLNKEDLENTIMDVMTNDSYHLNMMKLNRMINDEPLTPLERAVWWTEYVIRHGGAKHLRSPGAGMSFMEYYLVYDIIKILVSGLPVIFLIGLLFKFLMKSLKSDEKLKQK